MTAMAMAAIRSRARFCQGVTASDCTSPRATEGTEGSDSRSGFPDEALVFQLRAPKVQKQSASQLGRGQIVDDLCVVGGSSDRSSLDLEHDLLEAHEVDVIIATQRSGLVLDRTRHFLPKRDAAEVQFDREGVLVEQFE